VDSYRKIVLELIKNKHFTTCNKLTKQSDLNTAQVRLGLIALKNEGIVCKRGRNSWRVLY